MSRIHEALKRAEQERASGVTGGPGESTPALDMAGAAPAAALETDVMPVSPALSAMGSQFTPDTMLARCPQTNWNPDLKTMLFFGTEEQAYGTEEFRTLRSRLYQLREKQPLKKVLVSSALPKEGKSFVAANLAQVMVRQHGRRALLIDGDLRGARLHSALGTAAVPGLSEYLLGQTDEFSIMQRGPMENLFFIPSGRVVSSPAELLANGRLKLLLSRVEPLFDWIILDSSPSVPVSDAGLLANYCDGVLLVVRSNATPHDAARKAREEFKESHLVGVVLNGIEIDANSYTRYYYGSSYGNGNIREEAQR
ncbi:MAG TPA: CpsD/CapB family tyrosine-protein kinase [Terriglobales bacterium]|nr:CpsD/CapB family tyrosine-protein kinase [Terriglobales bacterium]